MQIPKDNERMPKDSEGSEAMFEHESRPFFISPAQEKKRSPGIRFAPFRWLVAALCLLTAPARADDWRQYRHDAQRTGASTDPVKVPLAEIWSRKSELVRDQSFEKGSYPTSTAVVAGGRLFSVSGEANSGPYPPRRALVSLDARTGVALWRRPLEIPIAGYPFPEAVGPVVTQSGVVLVYDKRQLPATLN